MLDFKTAGESHGRGVMAILDGLPAGIEINWDFLQDKMRRRQGGYGRGGRMNIEADRVDIYSGIRKGRTIGSPIGLIIHNKDWENWKKVMDPRNSPEAESSEKPEIKEDERLQDIEGKVTRPRPGHADLAGAIKYGLTDARNILERASARETAARTAVGGILDSFLSYFDIEIISHVIELGGIKANSPRKIESEEKWDFSSFKERVYESPLHCYDKEAEEKMIEYIDEIREKGDSLGGIIEIRTTPLPIGLGDHTRWNSRLDGLLSQALISIPAIKGVEIGPAFANSAKTGYNVHDEIFYEKDRGFYRKTNRAGGLEGGISNGQPLVARIAMKPIPTLYRPLRSVDIETKEEFDAGVERSDVAAVSAAGVVGEAMTGFILSQSLIEKFGGDHISEVLKNYRNYCDNQP